MIYQDKVVVDCTLNKARIDGRVSVLHPILLHNKYNLMKQTVIFYLKQLFLCNDFFPVKAFPRSFHFYCSIVYFCFWRWCPGHWNTSRTFSWVWIIMKFLHQRSSKKKHYCKNKCLINYCNIAKFFKTNVIRHGKMFSYN